MLYEELIDCLKELTKGDRRDGRSPLARARIEGAQLAARSERPSREEATSEGISSTTAAETKEFIKQLWKRPCFIELAWGQRRLW